VVFIGGSGRSGTTLLERLLGRVSGITALGEVRHLPERGMVEDQDCGCGEPFSACPFWSKVGHLAFGGWTTPAAVRWRTTQRRVDRNRHLPFLVLPVRLLVVRPRFRRHLTVYADGLRCLYEAAAEVGGASAIVDSSKAGSSVFLLRRVPGIDLSVVHVVRDSRGVAHSLLKEVARPEIGDATTLMPRARPLPGAAWWMLFNAMFHAVAATGTTTVRVRYEDVVAHPRAEITRLLAHLGVGTGDAGLAFLGEGHAELGVDHTVAGNPMRFRTGRIDLRPDEAWRSGLSPRQRRIVTALTAPLLLRYGYLRSRPSR
jgi:hypothetical protein